jgi:hypothetical protein
LRQQPTRGIVAGMGISSEGKIGIGLTLLGLLGAGIMSVAPLSYGVEAGWIMIAVAVVGGAMLGIHHFLPSVKRMHSHRRNRVVPLIGMLVSATTLLVFAAWYFWPVPNPVAVAAIMPNQIPSAPAPDPVQEGESKLNKETQKLIADKNVFLPIYFSYKRKMGPSVTDAQLESSDAISFYNDELKKIGYDLVVTSENVQTLAGNLFTNIVTVGKKGIVMNNGNGNVFDKIDITASDTGIDMNSSDNNKFSNVKINTPEAKDSH